jgi:hypothetical protein
VYRVVFGGKASRPSITKQTEEIVAAFGLTLTAALIPRVGLKSPARNTPSRSHLGF